MQDLQSKEGSRSFNRRRGPSRLFVLVLGALVGVLAIVLAVAMVQANQTRRDLVLLRSALAEAGTTPPEPGNAPPPASSGLSAPEMREWIATLRSEIADARSQTTKAVATARTEAESSRNALRQTLARILSARGATREEITSLVAELPAAERRRLLEELQASPPGGQDDPPEEASGNNDEPPSPPEPDPGPTPPDENSTPPEPVPGPTPPEEASTPPDKPGTAPADEVVIHTVRRGDTISAIALKHKVSQKAILETNKISNPRRIQIGQKLVIPNE